MASLSRWRLYWARWREGRQGRGAGFSAVTSGDLRQGSILPIKSIPTARSKTARATPHGVAIISQTCDILLDKVTTVVVAAIQPLQEQTAKEARLGARPRYVHLPALGDLHFADLDHIATIEKNKLVGTRATDGVPRDDFAEERRFAWSVGRRFSRFAVPDELVPWFEPLRRLASGAKVGSALSSVFDLVEQLRVQATSWTSFPCDLTLHVIVKDTELGEFEDEEPSDPIRNYFSVARSPAEIASKLLPTGGPRPTGADRDFLWNKFADSLAKACVPGAKFVRENPGWVGARSVDALISVDHEFTLAQMKQSETLDLAHLSAPFRRGIKT